MTKRRVRTRLRVAAAALVAVALLAGGWLWLRDSSLVAVRQVSIAGVTGPDADRIRSLLTAAARNMTTLDVKVGQLRTAVAPYPVVKDLSVSSHFPHGLRIRVVEQLPVAALVAGGRSVAAAGDGILLHDVPTTSLPTVPVATLPGGSQVSDRAVLDALALLADTPPRLGRRIAQVTDGSSHGLAVQLRSGPVIYFGDGSALSAKWAAASAVLADPGSAGASYVDVTNPSRPAAGVGPAAVAAAGLATGSSAGAGAGGQASGAATPGVSTPQPTQSGTASGG